MEAVGLTYNECFAGFCVKFLDKKVFLQRRKMGQSRMRIANWWYSRKEYSIAVKCYKKALQYYNNIPTNQVSSVRTLRKSTLGAYPLFHWDYRLWATHPQQCLGKLSHKVTRKRNQTHCFLFVSRSAPLLRSTRSFSPWWRRGSGWWGRWQTSSSG